MVRSFFVPNEKPSQLGGGRVAADKNVSKERKACLCILFWNISGFPNVLNSDFDKRVLDTFGKIDIFCMVETWLLKMKNCPTFLGQ